MNVDNTKTEEIFRRINIYGDYQATTATITELANHLAENETDEATWWIEDSMCQSLGDLIVGAFWHYSDSHAGQDSDSYACLCALGRVFAPNMSDGPEPESSEQDIYERLEVAARSQ